MKRICFYKVLSRIIKVDGSKTEWSTQYLTDGQMFRLQNKLDTGKFKNWEWQVFKLDQPKIINYEVIK